MKTVTIIGAGLAGTLLAIYLANRGYAITLYESRPDLRINDLDKGRSINLALSCRGLTSLVKAGLLEKVKKLIVPMRGRAIHEEDGQIFLQAFGRYPDEHINAIQRSDLNCLLLDEAEKNPAIMIKFNTKLLALDVRKKAIQLAESEEKFTTESYNWLIGADGAGSQVRNSLFQEGIIEFTRTFEPHGYKELTISPAGSIHLVAEHLHLWPRDSFLLLGNPNVDGSFTGSLFMPHKGKNSFAELESDDQIQSFFKHAFGDIYELMPNLIKEFKEHPTGHMSTIKASPWYFEDHCLLIGDAAHGIIPFFGQGMNSAFEDCRILDSLLDTYQDDLKQVLPAFYQSRRLNTEAVARMSMDNYREIQSDICDENFNIKKQLEQILMSRYPQRYISKHCQVMFTNTPYAQAYACGEVQAELLNTICSKINSLDNLPWLFIDDLMNEYDKKLANMRIIDITN